jgi:hypothetical protein
MSRLVNPLQIGLTDPMTFVAALEANKRRQREEAATSGGRSRKPKPQQQAPAEPTAGAQPPAAPTAPAATPAAPTPTSTAFDDFKAQREAALLAHNEELKALSAQGVPSGDLSRKRSYERYQNRLGQLRALENRAMREAQRPAKRAARIAADAERKRLLGERLAARDAARSAERSAAGDRSYTSVEDIRTRRPQSTQTAEPVNPSDQTLREMSQVPYRTPIADGSSWLDDAIRKQADLLRDQMKRTPTGQLSGLTEPSEPSFVPPMGRLQYATPAPRPAAAPAPTMPPEELIATLPPDQQKMVRDQMAQREMLAEMERMSTSGYEAIANRGLGENLLRSADDTVRMLESIGDIPVVGTALRTLFGPAGVAGAPLPQDLAQREIERARTPEELSEAQARQARSAMQGAFLDLVGGAAQGVRPLPRTIPTPAGRPVIDNPQVVGQTKPRAAYTPEGAIRVTPGQTGQVVDMPQVPGRGPYQAGLPEATAPTSGPMGMKVSDTVPPINQSQSPIGTIRRPYPATETLADGQGLLPGIRASEAPRVSTPDQSPVLSELAQPANQPLLPGMPRSTVTPKVPAQIQQARDLQRRVAQGRAANAQIARQLEASRAADAARSSQDTFLDALNQMLLEALLR